jgi:hypothetical protein
VPLRTALRTGAALAVGTAWWWALPGVGHGGPGAGVVLAGGWALGLVPVHATRPGEDGPPRAPRGGGGRWLRRPGRPGPRPSRAAAAPEDPAQPGTGPR